MLLVYQRHRTISRQGSTGQGCAGIHGYARECEDVSYERSPDINGRGAADLPLYAAGIRAIDQAHGRAGRRYERARHLEDEDRVGIALGVKGECPRQIGSGSANTVDALRERESSQIGTNVGTARQPRERRVRRGELQLCRIRSRWYA